MSEKRYFVVTHRIEGDCLGQVLAAVEQAASADICELLNVEREGAQPGLIGWDVSSESGDKIVSFRMDRDGRTEMVRHEPSGGSAEFGAALVDTLAGRRYAGRQPHTHAPQHGKQRGVVRPCHQTRSGLVVLRDLTNGYRTHEQLSAALSEAGYKASGLSPILSKLVEEGYVLRDTKRQGVRSGAALTSEGESLVLSDVHEARLREAGL